VRKSPTEERAAILGQPDKRPYGVRSRIHLRSATAIGNAEEVCVPLHTGAYLTVSGDRSAPWEGGKKYLVTLEGFPTVAAAEAAGRRLVQALLWMAVSTNAPLRLEYLSYEPASVYERNRAGGATVEAYAEAFYAPAMILGELRDAYALLPEPDDKLLLSMEIFCSARLEASRRAIFLALVSALEPLAREKPLGPAVDVFVDKCVQALQNTTEIEPGYRTSLQGRLHLLKRESIRQALRRLVLEVLPDDKNAPQVVDDAYSLRSQIIHSGTQVDLDVDLDQESTQVARTVRRLYASMLKRSLVHGVD
jgi:hypothetical protein